jgi:hypothetical protein
MLLEKVSSIRVSCEDTEKHRSYAELCNNFGHTFEGIACGGERMVVNEENGTQTVNRPPGIAVRGTRTSRKWKKWHQKVASKGGDHRRQNGGQVRTSLRTYCIVRTCKKGSNVNSSITSIEVYYV